MKTIIAIIFFAMIALNISPVYAGKTAASPENTSIVAHRKMSAREVKTLTTRLKEIHTLSKGNLNSGEKASLKKEVLSIKQQLNQAAADGVYISVGALILIIILLIILL